MAMDGDKVFVPRDIIIKILKRLPVKSLMRFKCVSKDWNNLLSTPSFIADHLRHSAHQNPLLLFRVLRRYGQPLQLFLLDFKMDLVEVQNPSLIDSISSAGIVGSSNGLLCVRRCNDRGSISSPSLLLWNPMIREVKELPRSLKKCRDFCSLKFGFSSLVNDYKIVRLCLPGFCDENEALRQNKIYVNRAEVFSLSTGSWKEIEFGNIRNVRFRSETVIANGAIFRLGIQKGDVRLGIQKGDDDDDDDDEDEEDDDDDDDDDEEEEDEDEDDVLVSFDIAKEVFTLIPMPASASEYYSYKLTLYEDKLAMFSLFKNENLEFLFELWVMEEGTGASGEGWTWTKKDTIRPFSDWSHANSIWRNEIVTYLPPEESQERLSLCLFNPTTMVVKKFPIRCRDAYILYYYTESLVPVENIQIEDPSS